MTLGEFREYTKLMRDDVELKFAYGVDKFPIMTFDTCKDTLVLCNKMYGVDDMNGIIVANMKLAEKKE